MVKSKETTKCLCDFITLHGVTFSELSYKTNISDATLKRYLAPNFPVENIPLKHIYALATAMGIEPVELIGVFNEPISWRLRRLRKRSKLTLSYVAGFVDVSPATISNWETGRVSVIAEEYLRRLATLYNVTFEYLVGYSNEFTAVVDATNLLSAIGYSIEACDGGYNLISIEKTVFISYASYNNLVSQMLSYLSKLLNLI